MSITWLTDAGSLDEPFEEFGSIKETIGDDNQSASVVLRCPWVDRYAVMDNILANALAYPYRPDDGLGATSGAISPFSTAATADGSGLVYEDALLTVNFTSAKKNDGSNEDIQIFSEAIDPTAEFITVPADDFRWGSDTGDKLKPDEAPGKLLVGLDYVLTYYNMTSIPSAFFTLIDHCNASGVSSTFFGYTFPAETLLYNTPSVSRSTTFSGTGKMTLKVRFTYKPTTWNKFWRSKTSSYEYMYHKDGGGSHYPNFPTGDFSGALP